MKKLLAIVLCIAMMLSMVSFAAMAEADYVVKLAGTDICFENISDAFTKANNPENKSVLLLKDCDQDLIVNDDVYINFYLEGHTINGMVHVKQGTLTLSKATSANITTPSVIKNTGNPGEYGVWLDASAGSTNLYISGVTVEATETDGVAVYADGMKLNVINNSTIIGNIETAGSGIININSAYVDGALIKGVGSSLDVKGGSFTQDPSAILGAGYKADYVDGVYKVAIDPDAGTINDFSTDTDGAYLLYTPEDVVLFRNLIGVPGGKASLSGMTFRLANDIDLAGITLAPAGNDANRFAGAFDGNGYTIKNVEIDGSDTMYVAFIGNATGTATVKDVTFENMTVIGGGYTAGIVGFTRQSSTIENCKVIGDIDISGDYGVGAIHAGGVIRIEDCEVNGTGTIAAKNGNVGGISGLISEGSTTVINNTVKGVAITSETDSDIGAIAGRAIAGVAGLEISGNEIENVEVNCKDATAVALGLVIADNGTISVLNNTATNVTVNGESDVKMYNDPASGNIKYPAATVNGTEYLTIQDAINAAKEGETVTVKPGVYTEAVSVSGKKINLEGTLDAEGNKLTTIKGQTIYAHSFNGTISNINIVDTFKAVYAEPCHNVNFDNIRIEGAVYGLHLVAYANGYTWNITNSYIDVSWANSLGRSGNVSADINFINNQLMSTAPYYEGSTTPVINTFNNNTKISNNVFGENARIEFADAENAESAIIEPNYFADGVSNAFYEDRSEYSVNLFPVYVDEEMDTLSNVTFVDAVSVGNVTVQTNDFVKLVSDAELTDNVTYALSAEYITPSVAAPVGENEKAEYLDISVLRNGTEVNVNGVEMKLVATLGEEVSGNARAYHFNGSSWDELTAITEGKVVRFSTTSMSPFAIVYETAPVAASDVASAIELKLEKKTDSIYDVVLYGADDKVINRFMSGELTFKLESDTLVYDIVKNGFVNVINPVDDTEKYGFNLDGTNAPDITGSRIVVASVEISGYGEGKLSVVNGVVRTAEIADNIVDTFVDTDATLILTDATGVTVNVPVPQQKLTIEIDFPNAVADNVNAYQQMWVTVSGGDLASEIPFNLGTDGEKLDGIYSVEATLTKNIGYNIKVEGAGYRTARYYIVMTEDKTVKFWNNVKDNDAAMEVYVDEFGTPFAKGATKINFLAGDIVADNTINIYDLSAVVSYFGEVNLVGTNNGYAKYDLNRDGKIDSKDVAYVLVSWGK